MPQSTTPHPCADLLAALAPADGQHPTALPEVTLWRATREIPRAPLVYEPCVVLIVQGHKVGYLGDERFQYDPQHYLALAVPMPFECETHASPAEPLLGLSVSLQPALVQELLLQLDETGQPPREPQPLGLCAAPITPELCDARWRLLQALRTPAEARVLGPGIVREIVFRVLQGPYGGALRALAGQHTHYGKIARALKRMHADYAATLDIETLAQDAHMSTSSFHHHFKAVTSNSPLQYLKSIRLHKARLLMAHEGERASNAALRVGYESVSQFNREFRRAFGASPGEDARQLRQLLGLASSPSGTDGVANRL